ncbi:MAG: TonB-dependent receptor [Labilibaculum sp.]|nr:TonB-dependent receptor [Labilibaculum sp.]
MKNQLLLFILLFPSMLMAQRYHTVITGRVVSENNIPLPGAAVYIKNTVKGTQANKNGQYVLENIQDGDHTIVVSFLGYKTVSKTIYTRANNNRQTIKANFTLTENTENIAEVIIKGETRSAVIERSGFAVTSIDTRDLQIKSAEINEILDKTPGLRVRRNGGLGSHTHYNINGLSGKAVRLFIDGVPSESFGSSYSVNSIPVSLIERIDVYKGVVPIELGNDAMGGAINIVTKQLGKTGHKGSNKSLNISYSYGSFNTHRADLTGSWRNDKTGITTRLSAFYNYSDNDYKVWSDDIKIKENIEMLPDGTVVNYGGDVIASGVKVRRFNDAYESYGVKADVGITDKKWADQLFFTINLSEDYKEAQHGPRMISPYGERFSEGWTIAPGLNYMKKDLFLERLDISANLQYSKSQRTTVDTTTNRYDWYGKLRPILTPIAGESGTASLNVNDNKNYIGRTSLSYNFNENHLLGISYSYNYFTRSSDDKLREAEERNYGSTSSVNKQITGITYQNTFLGESLKNSVFVKHYYNHLKQNKIEYNNGELDTTRLSRPDGNWGFGGTSSFALTPKVRFNMSLERAVRLVTANEVFGNVSDEIEESIDLEPEKSLNINLGGIFTLYENGYHEVNLNTNLFFRNTYDRIKRSVIEKGDDSYSVFENIGHIVSKGVEAQVDYRISSKWHFMVQGYYLDSRFKEKFAQNGSVNLNYDAREPNMPWLTVSANAEYNKEDLLKQGDRLSVSWFTSYVHEFGFDWNILGSQNLPIVPSQFINDVSLSYTFSGRKMTLSIDGKNVFNKMAFDNYAIQKPGRGIYAKISYRIF